MSNDIVEKVIQQFANNNITECDLYFENITIKNQPKYFCELYIVDGESIRKSLGQNPLVRNIGVIYIQLYGPLELGTRTQLSKAVSIRDKFTDIQINSAELDHDIVLKTASIRKIGKVKKSDVMLYQVNITIPYTWDEFRK